MTTGTIHAFDFLGQPPALPHFAVLYGDEGFLKQLVLSHIRAAAESDGSLSVTRYEGSEASWGQVLDELSTRTLFGDSSRVVVVRQGDSFVTNYRPELEDYARDSVAAGQTLVVELKSWKSNTRLAKALDEHGVAVTCKLPEKKSGRSVQIDTAKLFKWIDKHAASKHEMKLAQGQAQQIHELVGDELGLIDCELAKLALFADGQGSVTATLINDVVGGWRSQTTWVLLDAVCEGDAARALEQLDRLIQTGEHQLALFGAFSWTLRRFAAAVRIIELQERQGQRRDISGALTEAGISPYPREQLQAAERNLRRMGRARGKRLYAYLLKADLQLKGSHSPPHRGRLVLEKLILDLSNALSPQATVTA